MANHNDYPPPLPAHEVMDLIRDAQAGDRSARAKVVLHNMRLVCSICVRYRKWAPLDDLIQEGSVCLVRCVDRFDTERGTQFSTYATLAVSRTCWKMIEHLTKVRRKETVRHFDLHKECWQPAIDLGQYDVQNSWALEQNPRLRQALSTLDERERAILFLRLERRKLKVIGRRFGICKERVRQIESKALEKLSEKLSGQEHPLSLRSVELMT